MESKADQGQSLDKIDQKSLKHIGTELSELPDCTSQAVKDAEKQLGKFIYNLPPSNLNLITRGPVEFYDKGIYIGQWSPEGIPYGKGIWFEKNGSKSEGYWVDDELAGKGRQIKPDGEVREGRWVNGMLYGKGNPDEDFNCGEFQNYEGNSEVIIRKPNGFYYEGSFYKGKKHGFGKLKNKKYCYVGEFHNDQICGKGVMTYEDEKQYEGEFKEFVIDGIGVLTESSGRKYIGEFSQNFMHGYGEIMRFDKSYYRGQWQKNKITGIGWTHMQQNVWKKAEWKDGFMVRQLDEE